MLEFVWLLSISIALCVWKCTKWLTWNLHNGYIFPLQCAYCPTYSYLGPHITSPQCGYCILTRTFHTLIANTSTYWQIHSVTVRLLQVWKFPWRTLHRTTCLVSETNESGITKNMLRRCWGMHLYSHTPQHSDYMCCVLLNGVKPQRGHSTRALFQIRYLFEVTYKGDCCR